MSDPDDVSHGLLLRLFQSEFFSPHLALSYLKTYSDSIGITYYLVEQLKTAFDDSQVELYWAQLCHLLITKPSKSRALEYFVLQRCDESVHVALITLWFFQAALVDLSSNPHTDSFQICQRVFNQCQRILYDDPLAETEVIASSYAGSTSTLGGRLRQRLKIKAMSIKGEKVLPSNALPCLVGMGVMLASVPGFPSLAPLSGKMAIEQGRRRPQGRDRQPLEGSGMQLIKKEADANESDEEGNGPGGIDYDDDDDDDDDNDDSADDDISEEEHGDDNGKALKGRVSEATTSAKPANQPPVASTSSLLTQRSGAKKSFSMEDGTNALSQLTSGFNELKGKATAAVNDVFGQMGVDFAPGSLSQDQQKTQTEPPLWHPQAKKRLQRGKAGRLSSSKDEKNHINASLPNLASSSRYSTSSPFASSITLADESMLVNPEAILTRYDNEARRRLLRSNYCRKQTNFLQNLQDISARLLLLPKPARLSALRAELTELNHTLPSEVCFPLWCKAEMRDGQENSDAKNGTAVHTSKYKSGRHHRVVRINPSEAVVLNSADRVPYLLHVEVLVDDLDFDTERRQNREILKKLVMQEDVRRRNTAMSRNFSGSGQLVKESRTDLNLIEADEGKSTPREGQIEREKTGYSGAASATPTPSMLLRRVTSTPPLSYTKKEKEEERMEVAPEEEEIDLTEQAYGHDLSAFGEEKEEGSSDDDDLTTMNVAHDNAAWAQAEARRANAGAASVTSPTHRKNGSMGGHIPASKKKDFSLDEYAERMKTAAIMLAQLNQSTNASAHPVIASNPHVSSTAQGGWSSWIIGTSWANTTSPLGHKSESGQGSAGVKAPLSTAAAAHAPLSPVKASGGATTMNSSLNRSAPGSSRLMHTDTELIRKRVMQEMMALEEERMERMKTAGNRRRGGGGGGGGKVAAAGIEDEMTVQRAVNKDDPSAAMFRESWSAKKARIRAASPYGHFNNWDVFSVIIKTGADLRQEQLAVQLIQEFGRIWRETGSKCWIRYFKILVTSENSGIMETITDAVSVHSIKKEAYSHHQVKDGKITTYSLLDHFINTFGDPSSSKFNKARQNFLESLAAYSIISYLLHLKDRHNGNLLIDQDGHLIHIDFGYMLGISPGGVGFEAAPFKMPQEYLDILGGADSPKFSEFKALVRQGFRDVRKHAERIIMMVELMQKDSKLPCFALGELTATYLRDRFQLALSQSQCDEFVDRLILGSLNSTFTRLYDQYQYYSEGILS
ncbi:hypothetical protein CBS101457_004175 [Exobasidium rhododendri]|nr:hypothetical protein CBS101457_004175 [Exobasidium rhododendri]